MLAAKDFLSRVSQEKFWKCMEVKACLLKESHERIWKIAFMQVQLLKDSQVFDKKLPHSKNVMLVHKILGIESLGELVTQICEGERARIGKLIASLEWIKDRPRYDFKMRGYVKQTFRIDEACHIILKSGDYTNGIDSIVRELEPLDWTKHGTFGDLKDALDKLFGVEWGKPAYPPAVRIFAPIYVKIEGYKPEIKRIESTVNAAPEANLSKIKLLMLGEKEDGSVTEPIKPVTKFKRKNDSELLEPIVLQLDEVTRFVKLSLYYGDNLLEDFYVRIPKQVVRSIVETVGITERAATTEEKIRQAKQEIRVKYEEARNKDNDNDTKGKALEDVIKNIMELVPDLEFIDSRVVSDIQEVDVMVRNYGRTGVWADFDSIIFIECKNWFTERPGASILRNFKVTLDNKGLRSGIFVSPNGIAEGQVRNEKVYGADGQLDKFLQGGTKIVVLEDEDIWSIINCADVTKQINKKFVELYKM